MAGAREARCAVSGAATVAGVLAAVVLPAILAAQATPRDLVGAAVRARVASVVDGDTIVVRPGTGPAIRVRLEGIDAPERGEPFADAARAFARVLLFDKEVTVEGRDVDRFGRLVARLHTGGTDASVAIVAAGLACHYVEYSSDPQLVRAERTARAQALGFWAARERPRCTRRASSPSSGPRASVPTAGPFHGNTGSRVYHAPGCPNYRCRNCSREFAREEDARAAGFRPAGDCLGGR